MISIRKGVLSDIDAIMSCYDKAIKFMRASGNMNQWINGYPSRDLIINDIYEGVNYVGFDESGELVMTFAFILGEDPTYSIIENGEWIDDTPYSTIHRLASTGKYGGILKTCVDYCFDLINNIRLDTHEDNITMQNAATRSGFSRCGIIYCRDGSPRIAYQKIIPPKQHPQ